MKLECIHIDTCLPDFWSGHHLAYVQVPVYRGISPKALRNELRNELRQGVVMGVTDIARLLAADLVKPEEDAIADKVCRAAYAAINRDVRPAKKGTRHLFMDLEPQTDDVYAYFVFKECD